MKNVPLNSIFDIQYGNALDLTSLEICSEDSGDKVCYVSRTRENNGRSAIVKRIANITPFEAGLITVAGSGNSVLESFIQPFPFYTGYHVFILTAKTQLSENEKLFYCYCIRQNQYKYSFGRQANKTLGKLLVPATVPKWVDGLKSIDKPISKPILTKPLKIDTSNWSWFKYSDLFTIERGKGPRLKYLLETGQSPMITSTDQNNGWKGWTDDPPKHIANVISVARNGSVGESFYQPKAFCSNEDVHIFIPKFELNAYVALFLTTLIRKEKYRYNYGRKWGIQRMNDTYIKLPAKKNLPDFEFMENYIKSLPYSASI